MNLYKVFVNTTEDDGEEYIAEFITVADNPDAACNKVSLHHQCPGRHDAHIAYWQMNAVEIEDGILVIHA